MDGDAVQRHLRRSGRLASVRPDGSHGQFTIGAVAERDSLFACVDRDRLLDINRGFHAATPQARFLLWQPDRVERLRYGGLLFPERRVGHRHSGAQRNVLRIQRPNDPR